MVRFFEHESLTVLLQTTRGICLLFVYVALGFVAIRLINGSDLVYSDLV